MLPRNSGCVLLEIAATVHGVYVAAADARPVERLREVLGPPNLDAECSVKGLETASRLLHGPSTPDDVLAGLSDLYVNICRETRSHGVQVAATQNMAELMDRLLERGQADRLSSDSLLGWWTALSARPMSPALADAAIGASGRLMAVLGQSRGGRAADLRAWGRMMSDAGLDDRVGRRRAGDR